MCNEKEKTNKVIIIEEDEYPELEKINIKNKHKRKNYFTNEDINYENDIDFTGFDSIIGDYDGLVEMFEEGIENVFQIIEEGLSILIDTMENNDRF